MRIIGGSLGGRRLSAGVPRGARPTSDRVREAIASVLESRGAFEDAIVLDLFAGSGALGLEALSRGARSVLSVDQHAGAIRAIEANAEALSLGDRVVTMRIDLLSEPEEVARKLASAGPCFSLVFADPPYAESHHSGALLDALVAARLLSPQALVVIEYASAQPPPPPAALRQNKRYRYGDTGVELYSLED